MRGHDWLLLSVSVSVSVSVSSVECQCSHHARPRLAAARDNVLRRALRLGNGEVVVEGKVEAFQTRHHQPLMHVAAADDELALPVRLLLRVVQEMTP